MGGFCSRVNILNETREYVQSTGPTKGDGTGSVPLVTPVCTPGCQVEVSTNGPAKRNIPLLLLSDHNASHLRKAQGSEALGARGHLCDKRVSLSRSLSFKDIGAQVLRHSRIETEPTVNLPLWAIGVHVGHTPNSKFKLPVNIRLGTSRSSEQLFVRTLSTEGIVKHEKGNDWNTDCGGQEA